MKKLTIVVLTINGKKNLEILFRSLKQQTFKNFELIVSDNGSTDGTLVWLKKNKIKFIANGRNIGFSSGNNVALKRVKTKYCAVFNDDLKLKPNVLDLLINFLEKNPKIAAVQPTILNWDGTKVQSTGLITTFGAFIAERDKGKSLVDFKNVPEEILATHGACSVYRTEIVRRLGFFDERFNPIYNEDADLGFRIRASGFKNYWYPQAVIYHMGGFTVKKMGYPIKLSFHRNRYTLMEKHWKGSMWLKFLLWFPVVTIFYSFRKPDRAYFVATYEFIRKKLGH